MGQSLQIRPQQSSMLINRQQLIVDKFPLLSKRKEPIPSLSESAKDTTSLILIDRECGDGFSLKWIKAQLLDLFRICGAGSIITDYQVVIIARRIRKIYFYLSLSELTYFFESFISGVYGTLFVGKTINPQNLMEALRKFDNERINYFTESQTEEDNNDKSDREVNQAVIAKICNRAKKIFSK
jgi:hypothetical protein